MFTLNIHTENDAFQGERAPKEVARILRDVAANLEYGVTFRTFTTLFDINGNDVGRAKMLPDGDAS